MKENKNIEIIGRYGATLSLIEVGLGSMLHAFHIPMSGALLSLNQGYLLCRAAIQERELSQNVWTTYSVSNIAAVLKSLSPVGKKLGPMLSLSMQGLLFNIGTVTLGANPIGLCFAMTLLSLWTFIQPLITYYLFFGEKLFSAAEYLYQKTLPYHHLRPQHLIWIFVVLVLVKILLACMLAIIAWRRKDKSLYVKNYEEAFVQRAYEKMNINQNNTQQSRHAWLAFKDLLRPLFLVSLIMTSLFLYFSNHDNAQIAWYILRPIAIGFIFFYFSRTLTLERWLIRLESGRFRNFSLGCQAALAKVRNTIQ